MALTKIGAIIELEGANNFTTQMKSILGYAKDLKREMDVLTSSFDKDNKSVKDLTAQKELLAKQIQNTKDKLEQQKNALEQVNSQSSNNTVMTKEQAKEYEGLQRDVADTTIELNNLLSKQRELAEDNSLTLFTKAWQNTTSQTGEALQFIGGELTKALTVPLALAGTASVKVFSDYQTAFTGVRKTVEGTDEQLEKFSDVIGQIALTTGSSREEIAGVAEVAGQLGLTLKELPGGQTELEKFTRTMVMLGDSTNLTAEEAATALARVLNITGESTSNIDRIGAAVVDLGNNFATSESEIVAMTNRLAAGGTLVGLTTQEILGLATAMSSVGITAEAGGTAMNQTLTKIEKEFAAFSEGTESKLPRIAEIAGMSADEFADAWQKRPAEAIQAFISGLGSLDEKGESATLVLDELEMAGIRQSNMLKSLGLASEVLGNAMDTANKAYDDNIALNEEAERRYGDFAVQLGQLKESFKILGSEVGTTIGKMLLPVVEKLTQFITSLAEGWRNLPEPIQQFIIALGGILAIIGPILVAVGSAMIFAAKIKAAVEALGLTIGAFTVGTLGPIIAVILGVAAAIVGVIQAIEHWDEIVEFAKNVIAAFGEAFSIFGQLVSEIFKFLAEWISNKVTEIKNNIVTYFTNAKNQAVTTLTNFKNKAIELFDNIKTGISEKVNNIKESIVTGLSNAFNWITQKVNEAKNWGSDLVHNIANGIRNAIGAVTSAVKDVADKIRSYLHFSEPDVGPLSNFSTYMPDMMKLMAKGINDNSYLVENALSNLSNGMFGSLNTNGSGVNYGGVVINLNMPYGANGEQTLSQIETAIANRTMRRRMVFN